MALDLGKQTINDFGDQWSRYTDNSGFYGSPELFRDIVSPLIDPEDLSGKTVAEIGSGTGRIAAMLHEAGAKKIYAVEPAAGAFAVLQQNTAGFGPSVECLNLAGSDLPSDLGLDYVFSVGVIHHIPEPEPVVRAAFNALKPNGTCFFWLYGKEGNGLYLSIVEPLRWLTVRMPHVLLAALCHGLNLLMDGYIGLCRVIPLPLRDYCLNVIGRMTRQKRYLVIYDQLKPAYAKYYKEDEARLLLSTAGFVDIRLYHRRGYSWSVVGKRP